jgi:hypothetical protein
MACRFEATRLIAINSSRHSKEPVMNANPLGATATEATNPLSAFRPTRRNGIRRRLGSAATLAGLVLALAATPAFAYNQWVSVSGTVGAVTGTTVVCTADGSARWINAIAPMQVWSTTSSPQIIKTQQVLQKWVYESGSYRWKAVADARGYVAPVRTHDYAHGYMDPTVDHFVIGGSAYYRVVTKIIWPTGTGVALFEHQVINMFGTVIGARQDWCRY